MSHPGLSIDKLTKGTVDPCIGVNPVQPRVIEWTEKTQECSEGKSSIRIRQVKLFLTENALFGQLKTHIVLGVIINPPKRMSRRTKHALKACRLLALEKDAKKASC